MSETVLCRDCKHAKWNPFRLYTWTCGQALVPARIKIDPVTGPTREKAYYKACTIARMSDEACGKEGRLWAPKHKKDLFKLIKHVGSL